MEHFDKEAEFVVCVSVSRKGQIRTKSLTHTLRGNELVPYLFACNLLRTTHRAATHTFCCSMLLFFCDLLWFYCETSKQQKNKTLLKLLCQRETLNSYWYSIGYFIMSITSALKTSSC